MLFFNNHIIVVFVQDIADHKRYVEHKVIEGVHRNEPIKRIHFIADNDLIITGSASPKTSVVIIDRKGYKKPYTFKLTKVSTQIKHLEPSHQ